MNGQWTNEGAVGARQGDLRGCPRGAAEASLVGPGQGSQRYLRGQTPPEVGTLREGAGGGGGGGGG